MRSHARVLPTATVCFLLAAACQPTIQSAENSRIDAAADTIIGTVSIVGADPATFLALRPESGAASITLSGENARPLRSVSGAVVSVIGQRRATDFAVERFVVLRVNAEPVYDGKLVKSGAGMALDLTSGGTVPIANPSAMFISLLGSRIWMSYPVAGTEVSFGEIRAP